ncbi:hypothetical protein BC829DRAFT_259358 [Chytridium lagenaria]|nr:hypothetical protein BC829DRAFT_259358 [Chytridium lagenaria]
MAARNNLAFYMQAIALPKIVAARESRQFSPPHSGPRYKYKTHDAAQLVVLDDGLADRAEWFRVNIFTFDMTFEKWFSLVSLQHCAQSLSYRCDWEAATKALFDLCDLVWIDMLKDKDFYVCQYLLTLSIRFKLTSIVERFLQLSIPYLITDLHLLGAVHYMELIK